MSSRDAILGRIRNALAHEPPRELPPVPQVWPRENPGAEAMAGRFAQELAEVHGEAFRLASMDDARRKLAELAEASGWSSIGAVDRPLCRGLLSEIAPDRIVWAGSQGTPQNMAELSLGVVQADYLVADTGSAMIACGTPQERLRLLPAAGLRGDRRRGLSGRASAGHLGRRGPAGGRPGLAGRVRLHHRSQPHGRHREDPDSRGPRSQAAGGIAGRLAPPELTQHLPAGKIRAGGTMGRPWWRAEARPTLMLQPPVTNEPCVEG